MRTFRGDLAGGALYATRLWGTVVRLALHSPDSKSEGMDVEAYTLRQWAASAASLADLNTEMRLRGVSHGESIHVSNSPTICASRIILGGKGKFCPVQHVVDTYAMRSVLDSLLKWLDELLEEHGQKVMEAENEHDHDES